MSFLSASKIILVFLPFVFCSIVAGIMLFNSESKRNELNRIIKSSTRSVEEKSINRIVDESKISKVAFIEKQNAKLNMLGIEYKFETMLIISGSLFILGTFLSHIIFKAGILLMIYLGTILALSIFVYLNSLLEKRKKALTIEFLEKMRDITSYLSVGKSMNNAIIEAINSGNISNVMKREFEMIRQEIFTGRKVSDAFMIMYNHLQIEDIHMYADTLATHEETGGNIIDVMKAIDSFSTSRLEIKNAQNVFVEGQKSSQKVVIGIPLAMIIFFFIFNPSFFGNFYSTFAGQIVGIVSISVLITGVFLSNRLAKL